MKSFNSRFRPGLAAAGRVLDASQGYWARFADPDHTPETIAVRGKSIESCRWNEREWMFYLSGGLALSIQAGCPQVIAKILEGADLLAGLSRLASDPSPFEVVYGREPDIEPSRTEVAPLSIRSAMIGRPIRRVMPHSLGLDIHLLDGPDYVTFVPHICEDGSLILEPYLDSD